MLIIFVRAIVLYILVLIVMRLMGKREIGQMQPFELAISIMIADLAAGPMAELGIPLTNGILPILGLLVMHLLISILNLKSIRFREITSRKATNINSQRKNRWKSINKRKNNNKRTRRTIKSSKCI